jgi:hypothetical protein
MKTSIALKNMLLITMLLLFFVTCENEKNDVNENGNKLIGIWYSPTNDTINIFKNYEGVFRYYNSYTIIGNCKIENNSFSIYRNNIWESYNFYYDTAQELFIIYNFLQKDSIYFVKRPEWLNKLIAEIMEEDRDNVLGGHILYRYEWKEDFVYHFYDFLASCIHCNDYYEDGSKIDWSKENISDFDKNKKNEIIIWKDTEKLPW